MRGAPTELNLRAAFLWQRQAAPLSIKIEMLLTLEFYIDTPQSIRYTYQQGTLDLCSLSEKGRLVASPTS